MKSVLIFFEDIEHSWLKKLKNKTSWHDFLIILAQYGEEAIVSEKLKLKVENK